MIKDSKILGPSQIPSDKEIQEAMDEHFGFMEDKTKSKSSNTVSIDKAAEVFAEMLVELCPELLGFGGAAKEWENEFRKRLKQ